MRETCRRCLRPLSFCPCARMPPVAPGVRVVLLQHPREARLAICSAWLTHVALAGSELHRGVRFEEHPRVRELASAPGVALLYPGDGATPVEDVAGAPPATLIVLDATWHHSGKMLQANPRIAALPRIALRPAAPSGYGELRREPGPEHLSTIEAVAQALGALERDPARYAPMADAFRWTVAQQLACARGERRSPRHREPPPRAASASPSPGATRRST
jgi:DTW domain-containing protein